MPKRTPLLLALLLLFLVGCGGATPVPTAPPVPSETPEPTLTFTPTLTATLDPSLCYPQESYGPTAFPEDVNPLTGTCAGDPALLERRPLLVKISNLPRSVRPQWGLSLADIVYEYYTEEGTSRFAALFYGQDAEMVGPIRSARFIDVHLVRAYDAVFAFGLAYEKVLNRLYAAEFYDRLVVESNTTPLFRYDPSGFNHLMVDTAKLSDYITAKGVENGRQNLDGMYFQQTPPPGGTPLSEIFVRYSSAIYNRWQYDPALGQYLRFADSADDPHSGLSEQYTQSVDRLTGEALSYDNVVVLYVVHEKFDEEVWDIQLIGSGTAFVFRDGQMYEAQWQRQAPDAVVSLASPDGLPFPFKPGTTWFEVLGFYSTMEQVGESLRFSHFMP